VGTIAAALRDAGVADGTVVVFLGDNGCNTARGCRNRPLRGGKGTYWEGGVRVPFVLSWPGRVPAGGTYGPQVMAFDLFATFLRAAGGAPGAAVDGVDLLPYLQGAGGVPHPYLFVSGA
jgi:arylsulfatase A-like enzyme